MNDMKIFFIGKITNNDETVSIMLDSKYAEGLKGLEGYSHVQVLWWADGCDKEADRSVLIEHKPYKDLLTKGKTGQKEHRLSPDKLDYQLIEDGPNHPFQV